MTAEDLVSLIKPELVNYAGLMNAEDVGFQIFRTVRDYLFRFSIISNHEHDCNMTYRHVKSEKAVYICYYHESDPYTTYVWFIVKYKRTARKGYSGYYLMTDISIDDTMGYETLDDRLLVIKNGIDNEKKRREEAEKKRQEKIMCCANMLLKSGLLDHGFFDYQEVIEFMQENEFDVLKATENIE